MDARKQHEIYYFTVEGNTEQWYLQWLQKCINHTEESALCVTISCPVMKNPEKYAKRITNISEIEIYHLFDFESADEKDVKNFRNTMDNMKAAMDLHKQIQYKSGYSNLSFDLWIILHMGDCNTSYVKTSQYLGMINQAFDEKFKDMKEYKKEKNFKRCLGKMNLDNVRAAIRRAEAITQRNEKNGYTLHSYKTFEYYEENPSLSIWVIIKNILRDCQLL